MKIDSDTFELLASEETRAGWEIELKRRKNDWWCQLKHPAGWRYFGAPGDTAAQALLDAIAKRDECIAASKSADGRTYWRCDSRLCRLVFEESKVPRTEGKIRICSCGASMSVFSYGKKQ